MIPDVSAFQGQIDWGALAASNPEAVIIRAGYGVGGWDPQFQRNWSQAGALGLKRIAYWFCYPSYNAPEAEATSFNTVVGTLQPGEGMAGDFEDDRGNWASTVGAANAFDWARRFLTVTGGPNYIPGFYGPPAFLRQYGLAGLAQTWWLWIANWFVSTPDTVGQRASLWQFTDCATVPGVSGCCDASYPLVSVDSLLLGALTSPPVGGPPPVIEDTVVPSSPVSGRIWRNAQWYNWTDLTPLQTTDQTNSTGQNMVWTEAKKVNGIWYDRINGGAWALNDADVDDGGFDPTHFRPAAPPPPPTPPPSQGPPGPPGPPGPAYDDTALKARLSVLETDLQKIKSDIT